jgi:hypothetical protein
MEKKLQESYVDNVGDRTECDDHHMQTGQTSVVGRLTSLQGHCLSSPQFVPSLFWSRKEHKK